MAIANDSGGMKGLRVCALALAFVWAGWCTFFGIPSGLGEGMNPIGVLAHAYKPA